MEEKYKNICDKVMPIKIEHIEIKVEETCLEEWEELSEAKDVEMKIEKLQHFKETLIKTEKSDIKSERHEDASLQASQFLNGLEGAYEVELKSIVEGTSDMREHTLASESMSQTMLTYMYFPCDYKLTNQSDVEAHLPTHEDMPHLSGISVKYKCKLCDYWAKSKNFIEKHVKKHIDASGRWHMCAMCGITVQNKCNLRKHMLEHNRYDCDECEFQTKHLSAFSQHKLWHKFPYIYDCTLCDVKFSSESSFKQHMLMHKEEGIFQCKKCDFKTKRSNNLKKHQIKHKDASEIEWYECGICGKKLKYESSFKKHLLLHNNDTIYKCDECGLETRDEGIFNHHKMSHQKDPLVLE